MQSIDTRWNNSFKEYKIPIYDGDGNLVGRSNIGHYKSTYYMENDMEFFNSMNKFMIIIGIIAIGSIVIISMW